MWLWCVCLYLSGAFMLWHADGANILVIPIPLRSQFNLGVLTGDALRGGGHQVWLMGPPEKQKAMEKKGFHYLPYDNSPLLGMEKKMGELMAGAIRDPERVAQPGLVEKVTTFCSVNEEMCTSMLQNKGIMKQIADQHFDLAVMGTTMTMSCAYLIPYKFGIPYVSYMPLDDPWTGGVTAMPSFQPIPIMPTPLTNSMTFKERIMNAVGFIAILNIFDYMQSEDYQSAFAPERPTKSLRTLKQDSHLWFIVIDNTCLEYPRLSSPHYRVIGSLSPSPASPLTGDIKAYADGATEGFILMTSGSTNAWGQIMEVLVPMIKEVAPKLQQRIILQYVTDNPPEGLPSNVRYFPWIPQNDLLGHDKIKAVVSHGGANGQSEFTYHGVPIVCLGFMEEQQYNCLRLVERKFGVWLPIPEATTTRLEEALTAVIHDPAYKNNITRCSKIMRDIPHAKEEMLLWINHVLKFGSSHLRPVSADMPFYKLFMLDVMAFLALCLFVGLLVICAICKCFCRCARRTFKTKKD